MKMRPLKQGYRRLYVELLSQILDIVQPSTEPDDMAVRRVRTLARFKLQDEARRM